MTIMMKLFLILSFLALADAWLWSRRLLPFKKGTLAGKYIENGKGDPAQVILGAMQYLKQGIDAVNQRVDDLEEQIGEIEAVLSGEEGQEPGPEGTVNKVALPDGRGTINQEPGRSDETAVRMLLQQLESRLEKKRSEQKEAN